LPAGWAPRLAVGLAGAVPKRPGRAPLRRGPEAMYFMLGGAAPRLGSSAGRRGHGLDEASPCVYWHYHRASPVSHGGPHTELPRPSLPIASSSAVLIFEQVRR
jgi:hypothetical protein